MARSRIYRGRGVMRPSGTTSFFPTAFSDNYFDNNVSITVPDCAYTSYLTHHQVVATLYIFVSDIK